MKLRFISAGIIACLLASCAEPSSTISIQNVSNISATSSRFVPDEPYELPELSDYPFSDAISSPESSHPEEPSDEQHESSVCGSQSQESFETPSEEPEKETSSAVSQESSNSKPETNNSETSTSKPHKVNGFIVYQDRGMEPFGGSAKGGQYTAEVLNLLKERVGSNVNVYAMPIPLACTFYAPDGYKNSISCMKDCFYGLRDALVDVEFVDLISALEPHADEDIYARTDHHWMALGAYYASQEFCKVAKVYFSDLSNFEECSFDGFLGSVVKAYGVNELKKYPETFYWYEPYQEYTAHYYRQNYTYSFSDSMFSSSKSYVKFIYGDSYAVRIETGVNNGRKLLLIKDSYGNALAPFLIAGFEEIHIVDYRDFECNILEFIQENNITDVTVALSAFAIASSKRDNIIRLMEQ